MDLEQTRSMYLESVCQGLDIVLDGYRETLTQLEKEILYEGDTYPLTLVQHRLSPHRPVTQTRDPADTCPATRRHDPRHVVPGHQQRCGGGRGGSKTDFVGGTSGSVQTVAGLASSGSAV